MSTNHRLHALDLALAGGIWMALCGAWLTAAALLDVPGFRPVADALSVSYGPWGYSVSWPGVLVGGFWGFVEGFFHLGVLGLIYNELQKRRSS